MADDILKEILSETTNQEMKRLIECIGDINKTPKDLENLLTKGDLVNFKEKDDKEAS